MTKFPFKSGDHLLCEKGGELLREGGAYVAHSVTQPSETLYQWVYVDVTSGGREWMPASDFRPLA